MKDNYEYYPPKFVSTKNDDEVYELLKKWQNVAMTEEDVKELLKDENLQNEVDKLIAAGVAVKKDDYETNVSHPSHYADRNIEVIDYIEDCGFGREFCLGNVIKYVSRAGKKDPAKELEDLQKAQWYLTRYIDSLAKKNN